MENKEKRQELSSEKTSLIKTVENLEVKLANILNLHGPDHIELPGLYAKIARTYNKIGDFQKAVEMMEKAMEGFRELYLESDPVFVVNQMVLGCLYQDAGRYQEAIEVLEGCLSIIEEYKHPKYPSTSMALWNLARVFQDAGKHYQAVNVFEQVLKIKIEVEGLAGVQLVKSQLDLVAAYRKAGHFYKAIELLNDIMESNLASFPSDHPDVIEAKKEFVMNYWELGLYANAASCAGEVVEAERKIEGVDFLSLAASFYFQFRCYLELGEIEKSRTKIKEVYHLYKKHYGEEDVRTKDMKTLMDQLS